MRIILNVMCPEKQQKPVKARVLALSSWESGYAVPFPPQDFGSPYVFVYCSHNTGSCWPGSASVEFAARESQTFLLLLRWLFSHCRLCKSHLMSLEIASEGNCWMWSCTFGAAVGGGKFRGHVGQSGSMLGLFLPAERLRWRHPCQILEGQKYFRREMTSKYFQWRIWKDICSLELWSHFLHNSWVSCSYYMVYFFKRFYLSIYF